MEGVFSTNATALLLTRSPDPMVVARRLDVLARQLTATAAPVVETLQIPAHKCAIIVGGAVLDAQAKADVDIQAGSSVPGKVTHTPGGVARNIAACLCQLLPTSHPPPLFCTVLGEDVSGAALMASLQQMRLDTSHVRVVQGATTPTVLAILDRGGELVSCVADVQSVEEHLTPAGGLGSLAQDALPRASLLVCEANLAPASLQFLCAAAHASEVPIILEPVSVPKSKRVVGCLPYLTFITPNAMELVSIAEEVCKQSNKPFVLGPMLSKVQQHAIHGSYADSSSLGDGSNGSSNGGDLEHLLEELAQCAAVLLQAGTQHVLVTLGSRGAAIFSCPLRLRGKQQGHSSLDLNGHEQARREDGLEVVECVHLPALPPLGPVVSTSGAGDTLVGGLAAALLTEGLACHEPSVAAVEAASEAITASAIGRVGIASLAIPEQQQQQQQQQQQVSLPVGTVLHPSTMRAVALGMAAATAAIQSPSNVPLGLSLHKLTASASGLLNGQTSVHRFRCWAQ